MSKAAKRHMGRVANVGCIICHQVFGFGTPAQVHHIGDRSERSPFLTIPLCEEHHKGATGFHGLGEKKFNAMYKTSEVQLLAKTLEMLA